MRKLKMHSIAQLVRGIAWSVLDAFLLRIAAQAEMDVLPDFTGPIRGPRIRT